MQGIVVARCGRRHRCFDECQTRVASTSSKLLRIRGRDRRGRTSPCGRRSFLAQLLLPPTSIKAPMLVSQVLAVISLLATVDAFPGIQHSGGDFAQHSGQHSGGDFAQQRALHSRRHVPAARILPERDLGVYGDWRPAGPTDSRSPCPGLNS